MIITTQLVNGKTILYVAPETDSEVRQLKDFARPDEPITAEIRIDHLQANPLIIIRKERT